MKNLSDDLQVRLEFTPVTSDCYYTYDVIEYLNPVQNTIYTGRIFVRAGQTSADLYLNDIIESCKLTDNVLSIKDGSNISLEKNKINLNIYVRLYDTAGTILVNKKLDYLLNSTYPFKYYNIEAFKTKQELYNNFPDMMLPYLQGIQSVVDNTAVLELYPHYPALSTDKFKYVQTYQNGKDITTIRLGAVDNNYELVTTSSELSVPNNSFDNTVSVNLREISSIMDDDTEYIGISTNRWSHDKATGYRLYKIGFWGYNVSSTVLDPFIATWGYKDEYFKPYDVDYVKKYYIDRTVGSMTKPYVEFIALVPSDKQNEFTKDYNIVARLYSASKVELTQLTPVYSIGADFRGTSTINEMTELLYNAFGMDFNFFKYKNEDFYHFVEDENQGFIIFNLPYPVMSLDIARKVWDSNETILIADAFKEDSQTYELNKKYVEPTYQVTTVDTYAQAAIVDKCPAKYYLQWYDRFGGIQCQPFDGKSIQSVNYDRQELKDFKNHRRINNVGSQAKWELNTRWLKEEFYPYYESMFVSPYIKLYDTKEDKSYDVLIKDDEYTEKTWNNQKKLFNLTIKLEENTKRHLIY